MWIDVNEKEPFLRKVILRYLVSTGSPFYQAVLSKWQVGPEIPGISFSFTAPEGAKRIDMVPVRPAEE